MKDVGTGKGGGKAPGPDSHPPEFWADIEGFRDFLYRVYINRTFRKFVPGFIVFLVLLLVTGPEGLSTEGQRTIALFVFIVYLWITETFPLPVTAFMAGIGLLVLGVYEVPEGATDAFRMYAANAVFMILGSLILAQGLISSGADRLITRKVLMKMAKSTNGLLFGVIIMCALIAAVVPGHSVAAFMLPVVLSIILATDIKDRPREMVAYLISIAMGCAIGGLATPSGGARNAIAIGYLEDYYGYQVSYLEWVKLALPLTLILIPVTYAVVKLAFKVEQRPLKIAEGDASTEGGLRPYLGIAVLLTTIVLYLTLSDVLSLGGVAMIGGVMMFVFGLLRWEHAQGGISWGVIFIYGAALTLGEALWSTGAADWIAESMLGGLGGLSLIGLVAVVVIITALFTNAMSDAATVSLLLPVMLPLAFHTGGELDGDGLHYAFVVAQACAMSSAFAYFTVFGTPPNTIVYSSGHLTSRDYLKAGIPLWLISLLLMLLLVNTYWSLIL
jgi:sodium-dependent dicarboxylate transporter 2/3/5